MTARRRRLAPVPDTPGRVVLYTRVSALMGRTGDTFHSPDIQVEAMEALIGRLGLREVRPPSGDRIQDIDVSGRGFAREGLDAIRSMARAGQVDVIAVYDLSRLGRNVRESLNFISELRGMGVSIISTREQIDDTPQGQFLLGQFLLMAQLYSDQVGEGWANLAARRAVLGHHHGVTPRGYRRETNPKTDRPHGPLVIDPDMAPHVKTMFAEHAAEHRLPDIVRRFNSATGQSMSVSTLRKMLRNPVYIGKVSLHGAVYEGRHEGLVDEVTWARVQARLRRDATTPGRTLQIAYSMAGLVYCDACGARLIRQRSTQAGERLAHPSGVTVANACRRPDQPIDRSRVNFGTPLVKDVEAEVLRLVDERARDLVADVSPDAGRRAAAIDTQRLERQLAREREALGHLASDRARREITPEAYRAGAEQIQQRMDALQHQLDEATTVRALPHTKEIVSLVKELTRLWPELTASERHRALRSVRMKEIRIRPATAARQPLRGRVRILWW